MPLASLYSLHWYGPACAAMVVDASGSAQISARRTIAPALNVVGTGTADMRPYRGRRAALDTGGAGTLYMRPARSVRAALRVTVSELSQDDVTGAVLESKIEGDLTLKQTLRLLLAMAANDATGLEGATPVFKSLDGSKTRLAASYSGGNRTITTRDGT